MASLIGRIALRQILPARPAAKDPQNPTEHASGRMPRPTDSIAPPLRFANQGRHSLPVPIREVHAPPPSKGETSLASAPAARTRVGYTVAQHLFWDRF